MIHFDRRVMWGFVVASALGAAVPLAQAPAPAPAASRVAGLDQGAQAEFLRTAKVIRSRQLTSGVTSPYRLTLTDGVETHDAGFQSIDDRRAVASFGDRGVETNFVDSHHFNLAAYVVAGMLGLDTMMPVTVHRTWNGRPGTITWWIDDAFDERTRRLERREAPNPVRWAQQSYKMRLFATLVGDTDRNLGNVLITPDWKLWMIDFTRAFRLHSDVRHPGDLPQVDRTVLARLRTLDGAAVKTSTARCLTEFEAQALMKRRDVLVTHFDGLIRAKGAAAVLYGAEPPPRNGAGDGDRTRDIQLGKLTLYQLSYSRSVGPFYHPLLRPGNEPPRPVSGTRRQRRGRPA